MGLLIKRYREDRRMTQRVLAAAAGLSVGALRDLEQGRTRSPRWGTLEELAAILNLGQAQRAELARAFQASDPYVARRREQTAGCRLGVCVEILGPLTAWRDGTRLGLGSRRQRAVFGLLALHADADVHREAIIDMLWSEQPPACAVPKVQGYVSRLRKMLGNGPGCAEHDQVITTAGGCCYRLHFGLGYLDLAIFLQLIREARESAARSDPARACDQYEQALGLWRGDILADVDLLRGHPAAIEVARRRSEAVLGYVEAAIEAGVHVRALPQLRALCAREPFDEQAHAWLMTMLAATGRQAAALQIFAEVRRRLDTELGVAPGSVLTRAYARVVRQTPAGPL